jgi:hypothetical protein
LFATFFCVSRLANEFPFIVRHARVSRAQDATECIHRVMLVDGAHNATVVDAERFERRELN